MNQRDQDTILGVVTTLLSALAFTFLPAMIAWIITIALILAFVSTVYDLFGPFGLP